MQTFYFNTGVRPGIPENEQHRKDAKPVGLGTGQIWRNGTKQIPYDVEDLPEHAVFVCFSNSAEAEDDIIVREIHNSTMMSKYVHFVIPAHLK